MAQVGTFTVQSPEGSRVVHGSHARVMAGARRLAKRLGVSVKVTDATGAKWIALGGVNAKSLPWSTWAKRRADHERADLLHCIDSWLRHDAHLARTGQRAA